MSAHWAKVNLNYFTNPKVRAASRRHKLAPLVHLSAILYAAEHLTDGLADTETILLLTGAPQTALKACIDAGILYPDEPGMVRVHDYLEHQTPAGVVEEKRAARSAAGRKGAKARWGNSPKPGAGADGKSHGNRNANRMADRNATAMHRREVEIEIEQEEREKGTAGADPSPSNSPLTELLSLALRAAEIPHDPDPSWELAWEQLASEYGSGEVVRTLQVALQDPFWVATLTHPNRISKNWATLQAQTRTARTTSSRPASPADPRVSAAGDPPYPDGLQADHEREAWKVTWHRHIRAGLSPGEAEQATNREMNIRSAEAEIIHIHKIS